MAVSDKERLRECEFYVSGLKVQVQIMKQQWARQLNWARAMGFGAGTVFGTLVGAAVWRRKPTPEPRRSSKPAEGLEDYQI